MCTLFLPKNAQCRVLSLLLLLLLCRQCCVGWCCCCSWLFFPSARDFRWLRWTLRTGVQLPLILNWLGPGPLRVRVSRSVCLPDGQRSCPALPSLSAQLCSPPLIALINYIIKSVMTGRRPNHLPSSLSRWPFVSAELPRNCLLGTKTSVLMQSTDRANYSVCAPKTTSTSRWYLWVFLLFLCLRLCLCLSSSIVVWSFASAARVLQPLTLGQLWLAWAKVSKKCVQSNSIRTTVAWG